MANYRLIRFTIHPHGARLSYTLCWRTSRGTETTDLRRYWGVVELPVEDDHPDPLVRALRACLRDLEQGYAEAPSRAAGREPRGAVGGGSGFGQALAAVPKNR